MHVRALRSARGKRHTPGHLVFFSLHIPSVVLNRLGIDGRYAFVLLSGLIKVNKTLVCV